jgi:hypothetical protein
MIAVNGLTTLVTEQDMMELSMVQPEGMLRCLLVLVVAMDGM